MTTPPILYALRPILRDLAPTLLFLAIVKLGGGVLLAAGIAMAIGLAQVAWSLARRAPIEALQWLSLALVLIFGAATLVTHDARFIMVKPTLAFAAVGITMLKPDWQRPYVPPIARDHVPAGLLRAWGYAWAALMFALAAANAGLAIWARFDAWAAFSAFGPTVVMLVMFAAQYMALRPGIVRAIRRARGVADP